jgi:DNA primase
MNVKVLLLPDGDDPDSFSRKHTAEEFRDYVRTNSMDFVQYMVQVCLNPAGTDNTRRFEEINHIMSTIAIISNSVEQQLYTQELASILGMKEDIVARSIAAARKRYVEEKIRARNAVTYAQSSQANADPQVLKDPMDFKNLKDSTAPSPAKKGEQETVFLRKIEQNFLEIAQMIVEHGNEKYADNEDGTYLPIGMFLINGLREDGMLPQNPLVGKVLSEYESHFTDPGFDTVQWFTLHSDQELASFVASIISNETSENYAKDAYVLLNALKFNICDMRLKTEKNMAPEVRQALVAARASFDRKRKK